jgi:hypothetical protein
LPNKALKQPPSEFTITIGAIPTLSGQALVDEEIKVLGKLESGNARIEANKIKIGELEMELAAHEAQTAAFAKIYISKKDKKKLLHDQVRMEKIVRHMERLFKDMKKIEVSKETGNDKEMKGGNNMI